MFFFYIACNVLIHYLKTRSYKRSLTETSSSLIESTYSDSIVATATSDTTNSGTVANSSIIVGTSTDTSISSSLSISTITNTTISGENHCTTTIITNQ